MDYVQLVKVYKCNGRSRERYTPPEVSETIKNTISGNQDDENISTSHVERQNLTIRIQMLRFTRLTNAFSKKFENLKAPLALHFA